jgi:general secretion pathway protein H
MMRSLHTRDGSLAGFTLLEMLVVLGLITLGASIALPLLGRPSDSLRLRSTVDEMVASLRVARETAILRNAETSWLIDVDRRTVQAPAGRPVPLAPDVVVKLEYAASERIASTAAGFRFFADGSSTGGAVTLSLHERRAKICVQWLTGEARTC